MRQQFGVFVHAIDAAKIAAVVTDRRRYVISRPNESIMAADGSPSRFPDPMLFCVVRCCRPEVLNARQGCRVRVIIGVATVLSVRWRTISYFRVMGGRGRTGAKSAQFAVAVRGVAQSPQGLLIGNSGGVQKLSSEALFFYRPASRRIFSSCFQLLEGIL